MTTYYGWNMWKLEDGSWQANRPHYPEIVLTANTQLQMKLTCRRHFNVIDGTNSY